MTKRNFPERHQSTDYMHSHNTQNTLMHNEKEREREGDKDGSPGLFVMQIDPESI